MNVQKISIAASRVINISILLVGVCLFFIFYPEVLSHPNPIISFIIWFGVYSLFVMTIFFVGCSAVLSSVKKKSKWVIDNLKEGTVLIRKSNSSKYRVVSVQEDTAKVVLQNIDTNKNEELWLWSVNGSFELEK